MNEFKERLRIEYGNMQDIPLEPMTEEMLKKYEEHKRKRNERVFDKFDYKEATTRGLTEEQLKQQRELQEDLLLELRY